MPRCTWWSVTRPAKPDMVNDQIHAFGLALELHRPAESVYPPSCGQPGTIAQHEVIGRPT